MAYSRQNWQDRVTEHPDRRILREIDTGHETVVDIIRDQGEEFNSGSSLNAERFNHMEAGIAEAQSTADAAAAGLAEKQDALSAQNKLPYAYIADVPTTLPNPYPLTFGEKTYDGSAAQTLTAADIGLGTVFNLLGSKATVSDLPASGNTIGDVWYVIAEHVGYIWLNDGTARWEQLGLPIDLSNYAEVDGTYPDMSVGHASEADEADYADKAGEADNIGAVRSATVSTPFLFRPSGGGADVDGDIDAQADISKIYGKTLVWNQMAKLVSNGTSTSGLRTQYSNHNEFTVTGITTSTFSNFVNSASFEQRVDLIHNHKYYISAHFKGDTRPWHTGVYTVGSSLVARFDDNGEVLFTSNIDGSWYLRAQSLNAETEYNFSGQLTAFDLTQMFGAGNEPSTIEEFRSMFPLPYYAYDEGRLLNFTGTGIKTVGFNALAPNGTANLLGGNAYEIVGTYTALSYSTGETITPISGIFTPSADGILTVSGHVGTTCVHLVWSGYRNGEYEPYWTETKSLPVATYFPEGMKSVGTVRDELTNGKAIQRIGAVDLGTLNWSMPSTSAFLTYGLSGLIPNAVNNTNFNAVCSKYPKSAENSNSRSSGYEVMSDKEFLKITNYSTHFYIKDSSYTDATTFKSAMSGVMLYYELATPVETVISPPLDLSLRSADYGTEMLLPENDDEPVTTPMYADISYVQNLRDKLQRLPMSPSAEGDYIVHYDGVNQRYKAIPAVPSGDGVYTLKCTVTGGEPVFAWVSETISGEGDGDT